MKVLSLFFLVFLLAGCAQVGTLSGGEKDILPPKLAKSFPQNEAINFNQNKIELLFNEFVQLSNIQQQLIISPPVKTFPKVSLKGKRVVLTFDTLFRENTTYSLFFGDGIVDFNERNPWEENTLVFATGNRLDSLQVSGSVKNSFDDQPEQGMFVLLYPSDQSDSVVAKSLPAYFAKTDKTGNFQIKNIHEGDYHAFALKDINSNYLFDQPNEKIAFHSEELHVNDNVANVNLSAFTQDYKKQYLFTRKFLNEKQLLLAFNKKNKSASIEILDEKEKIHHIEKHLDGDSLVLWLNSSLTQKDSLVIKAKDVDFSDTLTFFLKEAKPLKEFPLKINKDPKLNMILPGDSVYFSFNFPLQAVNPSLVSVTQDSLNIPVFAALSGGRKLALKANATPSKVCKVKFLPGCINDIYGRNNTDTIHASFTVVEETAFGMLLFKLDVSEANIPFVMQMISSKKELVKEEVFASAKMIFDYKNLPPDEYKIKLIYDVNGNGRWDTGNYYLHQQPEKIIYYEKPLTVRANWEMEIEWIVLPK